MLAALPRLALPLLLVLSGCGDGTREPAPSPTASPTASVVPRPARAEVSATAVGGVPVGTPAADAEQRLVRALGTPDSVSRLVTCTGAEGGKAIRWGDLVVTLNDGAGRGVVLQGWEMGYGQTPFRLQLPFGIAAGAPLSHVLRTVPGATGAAGEGPLEGTYVVTTPRVPGLAWVSHGGEADGTVDEVTFRPFACD